MTIRTPNLPKTADHSTGSLRLRCDLPSWLTPNTPSCSCASAVRGSPSHRLRRNRAKHAAVDAKRIGARRENCRAISLPPPLPSRAVLTHELQHATNRVHSGRCKLGSDTRRRSASRSGRLRRRTEALPQHTAAPSGPDPG